MNDIHTRLAALGVGIPEILLPHSGIDLSKWAVIACDQFTQDIQYWEQVKNTVAGAPSCLNLIFPEAYLEAAGLKDGKDRAARVRGIRDCMDAYIKGDTFAPPRRCCVYLERATSHNPKRRGLVLSLDLERYDWAPESRPLIRSTEGTVTERLPPRIEIRRGAPLELPHILILIDDEEDRLIPSIGEIAGKGAPLYKTPLMMGSGAVSGWAADTEDAWRLLADGLQALAEKADRRYGTSCEQPFLFAVGDGNHSLATAKAVWEEYKKAHAGEEGLLQHPARWALVEIENIYDPGISFEPIHRVIFGIGEKELLEALSAVPGITCQPGAVSNTIRIESLSPGIVTAALQPFLDSFVAARGFSMDYIHGESEVQRITATAHAGAAVGLILPPVRKDGFFKTVARHGPLPRKSFSMGEAEEKRFYLECRKLFL
ncbi:MAG: DUF1015 domain-containing protein [Treponema sp.]|nr:DUF1015 domain-containing protein [Treponema sp.]